MTDYDKTEAEPAKNDESYKKTPYEDNKAPEPESEEQAYKEPYKP